jgi:hypothetical protein
MFAIALETSLRAILAALCVGAILAALRVRSAAVRHAAWTAVMAAMLFMPVLPKVAVPIPLPAAEAVPQPPAPDTDLRVSMPEPTTAREAPTPAAEVQLHAPESPGIHPPASRAFPWRWAILGLYLTGLAALLARLAIGWRGANALARAAEPVSLTGLDGWSGYRREFRKDGDIPASPHFAAPVYESADMAAPLTVGIFGSRILLPLGWREWPAEKLRAALAHETAHARRRDGAIALLAQVNRCLFWFHPLAWWLEREILRTAEQAADEAALQATGAGREYAQALLEMADAVRRRGGLRAAEALSMAGGALERRIDSILSAPSVRPMSWARKAAVAGACAVALFLVGACRQNSDAALVKQAESREREYKERAAKWQASLEARRHLDARGMTKDQAATLEASLKTNPDDFDARRKLMAYYGAKLLEVGLRPAAQRPPFIDYAFAKPIIAAALPHYFWIIEHHPEDQAATGLTLSPPADGEVIGVFPSMFEPRPDPRYLERARKIWLEQADRDGRPAAVYYHAFQFFRPIDKPLAERMILRAQAADPKGDVLMGMWNVYMWGGSWSTALGDFYAQLLTSREGFLGTGGKEPHLDFLAEARRPLAPASPYAVELRTKLESSNDASLLLATASRLVGMSGAPQADLEFGESLIRRALSLQPASTWARQLLNMVADQRVTAGLPSAVWQGDLDARHKVIEQLAAGERFRELTILAISAGDKGVRSRLLEHNEAAAKAAWQRADGYAREAMDMAPQARSHADYGTAFFNVNMILGMAAVEAGDAKTGASYLLKAADAPVTDALRYPIPNARPWAMNWHFPATLEAALLKAGERDAVMTFLKRYADITVSDRDRSLQDLALMRQGKTPSFARPPV